MLPLFSISRFSFTCKCFGVFAFACALLLTATVRNSTAGDWPMYRQSAGRAAVSDERLPEKLHVEWKRVLPKLTPAYQSSRLHFDAGYEPVAASGLLVVGSSHDYSVTAYRLATGEEAWKFFTNGPVRFAPAIWKQSVLVGSDDGHLYCLDLATGKQLWKFRAVPSDRKLLGNDHLISVWPVRGGPVVADGVVYFTAGVWPFEGIFAYALDAQAGEVIWKNDQLGVIYGDHPHRTVAVGGVAPQGYLVLNDDELIVPCSAAYPARLSRKTGELIEFSLPKRSRYPGGWFAAVDSESAKARRRGKVVFDNKVNEQRHEDKVQTGDGLPDVSRSIEVGGKAFRFDDPIEGVEGTIHSLIAAEGKLIVVTREGMIYALGEGGKEVVTHDTKSSGIYDISEYEAELSRKQAEKMLAATTRQNGYALVIGLKNGELIRQLLQQSKYQVIGIDFDPGVVDSVRKLLIAKGAYGPRCTLQSWDIFEWGLPPYLAELITTEDGQKLDAMATVSESQAWLPKTGADFDFDKPTPSEYGFDAAQRLLLSLRPYGGVLYLPNEMIGDVKWPALIENIPASWGAFKHSKSTLKIGQPATEKSFHQVVRSGGLKGATNYTGQWEQNNDALVRFPLGVLWYNDHVRNFKRSPQPTFIDGVMTSRGKRWLTPRGDGRDYSKDYPLFAPVFSDVYTGRLFETSEATSVRKLIAAGETAEQEPSQYRPPSQKNDWKPGKPKQGTRINPLTGQKENRSFPKNYGCDGGVDYGHLFTMRSGTPAFYDKRLESGTFYISGPRSGCTNSIIPANGLLNVPYFYEGCTCSYPLPISLSLFPMPETHEQWAAWGESQPEQIERIGINFGAPGDRMTKAGTLWLNYPDVGGPGPQVETVVTPENVNVDYGHSLWIDSELWLIEGGESWPWVLGSAVEGLDQFQLKNMKPGRYTVRLAFAAPAEEKQEERVQAIEVQGKIRKPEFDIAARSKMNEEFGHWLTTGTTYQIKDVEIDGTFNLKLTAKKGRTRICGIELIRTGDMPEEQAKLDDVFLLPYFLNNGETGVYLAYSKDGLKFDWLNDGKVVMPAPPWKGENLTRDPSIVFHDGRFHMVWTTSWKSRSIGYAYSTDLMNWSTPQKIDIWGDFKAVKNTWAPELHWDPEKEEFLILWSSTTVEELGDNDDAADAHGYDHRTYAARTLDFKTFTKPQLFFSPRDPEYSVIDPYIAFDDRNTAATDDDRWVMVIKNEMSPKQGGKNLRLTFGKSMQGPYETTLGPPIVGAGTDIVNTMGEGPSLFKHNREWHLYWDAPGSKYSYCLATSKDLKTWVNRSDEMQLPTKKMRHGTVLTVPENVLTKTLPRTTNEESDQ